MKILKVAFILGFGFSCTTHAAGSVEDCNNAYETAISAEQGWATPQIDRAQKLCMPLLTKENLDALQPLSFACLHTGSDEVVESIEKRQLCSLNILHRLATNSGDIDLEINLVTDIQTLRVAKTESNALREYIQKTLYGKNSLSPTNDKKLRDFTSQLTKSEESAPVSTPISGACN